MFCLRCKTTLTEKYGGAEKHRFFYYTESMKDARVFHKTDDKRIRFPHLHLRPFAFSKRNADKRRCVDFLNARMHPSILKNACKIFENIPITD